MKIFLISLTLACTISTNLSFAESVVGNCSAGINELIQGIGVKSCTEVKSSESPYNVTLRNEDYYYIESLKDKNRHAIEQAYFMKVEITTQDDIKMEGHFYKLKDKNCQGITWYNYPPSYAANDTFVPVSFLLVSKYGDLCGDSLHFRDNAARDNARRVLVKSW